MKRRSRCEWMPMLPWPIWPLAGHARLGQNVVVGSMTILLSWLCWGASQEEVCLDPCFLCNLTPPRFSVELPVCVYVAAQLGVFVSQGPFYVRSSGRDQAPGVAAGPMAGDFTGGQTLQS